MPNSNIHNKKGIVLFVVLATIFMVILLGNIILNIMSSQSRLTHHQVSRIQAYYAATAGANYAFDKLRRGGDPAWFIPAAAQTYPHCLCRTLHGTCGPAGPACDMQDITIPTSIQGVLITVSGNAVPGCAPTPGNVPACITAMATYTYTP